MYIMICYTHIYILYTPTTPVFEFEVKLLYPWKTLRRGLSFKPKSGWSLGHPAAQIWQVYHHWNMNIDNPAIGKGPYWKYHFSDLFFLSIAMNKCWDPHAIVTPATVGAQSWSIVHMLLHSPSCSPRKRVWVYIANVGNPLHGPSCWWEDQGPHIPLLNIVGSNSMKVSHMDIGW
jgi:hypothetical protein